MKRLALIAALVLGVNFGLAQTPPGQNLNVPNSSGGGGGVTAGTTTTSGCGALGILFNNAGVIGCTANATLTAAGLMTIAGTITGPADANTFSFATVATGFGFRPATTAFVDTSNNMFALLNTTNAAKGFLLASNIGVNWSNTATATTASATTFQTTLDTGIARNAAGVVEVNTGTAGAFGALKVAALSATLPTATGTNVVCNTPGTATALSVQVSATGCAASSARFKEGIASIDPTKALDDVLRFQPVSYFYRPEFNMGSDRHVGFTAEQIASVDPQWITYEADGVTPHAVKYNEMTPLLAAAIQALKADNDNLRAELEDLKRRVR